MDKKTKDWLESLAGQLPPAPDLKPQVSVAKAQSFDLEEKPEFDPFIANDTGVEQFANRHAPPSETDNEKVVEVVSVDDLIMYDTDVVPFVVWHWQAVAHYGSIENFKKANLALQAFVRQSSLSDIMAKVPNLDELSKMPYAIRVWLLFTLDANNQRLPPDLLRIIEEGSAKSVRTWIMNF